MTIKIGINGFGRIGRVVFRAALNSPAVDVIKVNDFSPEASPDRQMWQGNPMPRSLASLKSTVGRIMREVGLNEIQISEPFSWDHDACRKRRRSTHFDRDAIQKLLRAPERIETLSSRDFEFLVAELFNGLGYSVTLTKATRDGGIDLVAEKVIDGMRQRYVVQCKHTSIKNSKIGVPKLRELFGVVASKGVTAGIMVTNALLTKPAIKFIRENGSRLFAIAKNGFRSIIDLIRSYLVETSDITVDITI